MDNFYEHRQVGSLMLFLLILPVVGFVAAIILAGNHVPLPPFLLVVAIMLLTVLMFWCLTVRVDRERVQIAFGLGFPSFSFALSEIMRVKAVHNPVRMGIGIHFIGNGMIYNIAGREGVEITFTNGRRAIIGTDEPEALVQAIQQGRRMNGWQVDGTEPVSMAQIY
jgi:hypothetical protein